MFSGSGFMSHLARIRLDSHSILSFMRPAERLECERGVIARGKAPKQSRRRWGQLPDCFAALAMPGRARLAMTGRGKLRMTQGCLCEERERRSNLGGRVRPLDCFAALAMMANGRLARTGRGELRMTGRVGKQSRS